MNPDAALILIVIPNDEARHAASQVLADRGYRVRVTGLAKTALVLLDRGPVSCVVLDASLAFESQPGLLETIRRQKSAPPVLLVGGDPSMNSVLIAMARGVHEYLPRPLEIPALASAVARAIGDPVAPGGTVARQASVEPPQSVPKVPEATAPQAAATHPSQQLAATALDWLVRAMEAKDPHLPGHSLRVAELAASIAAKMGRADWEVEEVRLAGRLHDIGMIAIGDGILSKAGPLTAEEYAEVKRHPVLGSQILSAYPNMERVASYVRGHHERWDGSGYPDRTAGDAIPWGARILSAAETFDALTSSRAYRSASSVGEALEKMHELSDGATDPEVMRVLHRLVSKRETLAFIRDEDTLLVERDLLTGRDAAALEEVQVA